MDEKQAWSNFARTGKIEDYIKYTQIRNQAGGSEFVVPTTQEVRSVFPVEVQSNASEDPGAHYPGADSGGERQAGNSLDPR